MEINYLKVLLTNISDLNKSPGKAVSFIANLINYYIIEIGPLQFGKQKITASVFNCLDNNSIIPQINISVKVND